MALHKPRPKKVYRPSPVGTARFAWVTKPDTKYNEKGLYHVDLIVGAEHAEPERAMIEAEAKEAFEAFVAESQFKAAEAKKWGIHLPFDDELDGDGKPTGNTIFKYKQNAQIPLADGSVKTFKMGVRDAKNKEITTPVFGGDTIRVLYAPRAVPMNSLKKVGLRLDFCMVQLIKKANTGGKGFDEVEGGYTQDFDSEGDTAPAAEGEEY
jgi:hypothetical protein